MYTISVDVQHKYNGSNKMEDDDKIDAYMGLDPPINRSEAGHTIQVII